MKNCALIIADDSQFREWLGMHASTFWPNLLIEHTRLSSARRYLNRRELERYRLIVVRMSFDSDAAIDSYARLMRILMLKAHPPVVVIADGGDALTAEKTARLGASHHLSANELTRETIQSVLKSMAGESVGTRAVDQGDGGAPNIPGYRILEPLAASYTSTVYRAFSERHRIDVALKIVDVETRHNNRKDHIQLREEHAILQRVGSGHAAKVYDYGEISGLAYMALEYFPRGSIDRVLADSGRPVSRLQYMLGVAAALREVHRAGYLHLDLKPDNVMIRDDGAPTLIDFGISKRIAAALKPTRQRFPVGSPYYLSPEQARGEPMDERSDIFSFGALWYSVFTGRKPFRGKSVDEIVAAHDKGFTPSMGNALRHYQPVIDGTLARLPNDRFADTDALIDEIENCTASATGLHRIDLPSLYDRLGVADLH